MTQHFLFCVPVKWLLVNSGLTGFTSSCFWGTERCFRGFFQTVTVQFLWIIWLILWSFCWLSLHPVRCLPFSQQTEVTQRCQWRCRFFFCLLHVYFILPSCFYFSPLYLQLFRKELNIFTCFSQETQWITAEWNSFKLAFEETVEKIFLADSSKPVGCTSPCATSVRSYVCKWWDCGFIFTTQLQLCFVLWSIWCKCFFFVSFPSIFSLVFLNCISFSLSFHVFFF